MGGVAAMISVRRVSVRFGELAAVRDVSLDLERGRTTALIGPSGCGKSTLLRLMLGLVEPGEGWVEFDGRRLDRSNRIAVRKRVGYAIQSGGLFPHMTARRNVELPARHADWDRARVRERIGALAELMHLSAQSLSRYPAELSGGQRQRVALMRALVLDPEVLLLDEPLGALDPVIRGELQHELREVFAGLGKTVVLVTHDLAEAAYLAPEDIVLMRGGRIVQRGSFAGLRSDPVEPFVERFVASQTERVAALLGGRA